jgi:2-methylcitrate dehydratase PrpD
MDMRDHYSRWHATSTVSVFAATAAAGRLMGLSVDELRCALGLVGSMAAGSRQNFGTLTKPLHAGLAARDAVFAAGLAARGFTADPDQLESPLGFFAVYANRSDPKAALDSLARGWPIAEHGFGMKTYPCCYSAHRAITAALSLAPQLRADDIDGIRLTLEPNGYESLIHHRPTTPAEAKFSAEYCVATALLDRAVALDSFTEDAVRRPAVRRLVERVELAESPVPPIGPPTWEGKYYAVVRVDTANGPLVARADKVAGDGMATLDRADIEGKFRACVRYSGAGWDTDALLAELWTLRSRERFTGFATIAANDLAA